MPRIVQTFTDFGNRTWKDRLTGGKADDKRPEDFPEDDIEIGSKVEREHTSNPDIATEIAMDHLEEDPEYYDKLISSGIADEEDAVDLFDELKGKNAREKSKKDIMDFMEEDDYDEEFDDLEDLEDLEDEDTDELENNLEDDEDFDEDELGTDKDDVEDDELIIDDEEEPKNKKKIMENTIKNYKSFLNESQETAPEPTPGPPPPGPERKYSKENKYKFQMEYDKKVVDKLNTYNFTYFVPDDQKDKVIKPATGTHFIVIDILNLNYAIVDHESPDIRFIDPSRLKHLLEGL